MELIKKIDAVAAKVLKWFVIAMCIGIAFILLIRVISRFTPFTIPMSWSDEVVECMMAWMIFTTSTLITRDGGHFRVDLLQAKYQGKRWIHVLNALISLISVIFMAVLLYYSINLVQQAKQFTPILKISVRYLYASIPVNCALMLLYFLRDFFRDVKSVAV